MELFELSKNSDDLAKMIKCPCCTIQFSTMKNYYEIVESIQKLPISTAQGVNFVLKNIIEFEKQENIIIHNVIDNTVNLLFRKKEYNNIFYDFLMSRILLFTLEN